MSGRQAHYAARRVPWRQVAGALVVCSPVIARADRADSLFELLPLLRLGSLALAAAAVYALHDPAASVTESTRPGRFRLRVVAAGLTFAVVAACWLALVASIDSVTATELRPLVPALFIELVAMFTTGLLVGSVIERDGRIPPAWGAAALVMLVAATLTSARLRGWLWVDPGWQWRRAHARWAAIAATSLFAFALASRDPARAGWASTVNRSSTATRQNRGTPV